MREKQVEQKIVAAIRKLDEARVVKVHGSQMGSGGEPDLDACIQGRSVKIEVKAPGRKPTPRQLSVLRKWEAAGALAGWADSVPMAMELLTHLDESDWTNSQLSKETE